MKLLAVTLLFLSCELLSQDFDSYYRELKEQYQKAQAEEEQAWFGFTARPAFSELKELKEELLVRAREELKGYRSWQIRPLVEQLERSARQVSAAPDNERWAVVTGFEQELKKACEMELLSRARVGDPADQLARDQLARHLRRRLWEEGQRVLTRARLNWAGEGHWGVDDQVMEEFRRHERSFDAGLLAQAQEFEDQRLIQQAQALIEISQGTPLPVVAHQLIFEQALVQVLQGGESSLEQMTRRDVKIIGFSAAWITAWSIEDLGYTAHPQAVPILFSLAMDRQQALVVIRAAVIALGDLGALSTEILGEDVEELRALEYVDQDDPEIAQAFARIERAAIPREYTLERWRMERFKRGGNEVMEFINQLGATFVSLSEDALGTVGQIPGHVIGSLEGGRQIFIGDLSKNSLDPHTWAQLGPLASPQSNAQGAVQAGASLLLLRGGVRLGLRVAGRMRSLPLRQAQMARMQNLRGGWGELGIQDPGLRFPGGGGGGGAAAGLSYAGSGGGLALQVRPASTARSTVGTSVAPSVSPARGVLAPSASSLTVPQVGSQLAPVLAMPLGDLEGFEKFEGEQRELMRLFNEEYRVARMLDPELSFNAFLMMRPHGGSADRAGIDHVASPLNSATPPRISNLSYLFSLTSEEEIEAYLKDLKYEELLDCLAALGSSPLSDSQRQTFAQKIEKARSKKVKAFVKELNGLTSFNQEIATLALGAFADEPLVQEVFFRWLYRMAMQGEQVEQWLQALVEKKMDSSALQKLDKEWIEWLKSSNVETQTLLLKLVLRGKVRFLYQQTNFTVIDLLPHVMAVASLLEVKDTNLQELAIRVLNFWGGSQWQKVLVSYATFDASVLAAALATIPREALREVPRRVSLDVLFLMIRCFVRVVRDVDMNRIRDDQLDFHNVWLNSISNEKNIRLLRSFAHFLDFNINDVQGELSSADLLIIFQRLELSIQSEEEVKELLQELAGRLRGSLAEGRGSAPVFNWFNEITKSIDEDQIPQEPQPLTHWEARFGNLLTLIKEQGEDAVDQEIATFDVDQLRELEQYIRFKQLILDDEELAIYTKLNIQLLVQRMEKFTRVEEADAFYLVEDCLPYRDSPLVQKALIKLMGRLVRGGDDVNDLFAAMDAVGIESEAFIASSDIVIEALSSHHITDANRWSLFQLLKKSQALPHFLRKFPVAQHQLFRLLCESNFAGLSYEELRSFLPNGAFNREVLFQARELWLAAMWDFPNLQVKLLKIVRDSRAKFFRDEDIGDSDINYTNLLTELLRSSDGELASLAAQVLNHWSQNYFLDMIEEEYFDFHPKAVAVAVDSLLRAREGRLGGLDKKRLGLMFLETLAVIRGREDILLNKLKLWRSGELTDLIDLANKLAEALGVIGIAIDSEGVLDRAAWNKITAQLESIQIEGKREDASINFWIEALWPT